MFEKIEALLMAYERAAVGATLDYVNHPAHEDWEASEIAQAAKKARRALLKAIREAL